MRHNAVVNAVKHVKYRHILRIEKKYIAKKKAARPAPVSPTVMVDVPWGQTCPGLPCCHGGRALGPDLPRSPLLSWWTCLGARAAPVSPTVMVDVPWGQTCPGLPICHGGHALGPDLPRSPLLSLLQCFGC